MPRSAQKPANILSVVDRTQPSEPVNYSQRKIPLISISPILPRKTLYWLLIYLNILHLIFLSFINWSFIILSLRPYHLNSVNKLDNSIAKTRKQRHQIYHIWYLNKLLDTLFLKGQVKHIRDLSWKYPGMWHENRDIYWRGHKIQETLYIGQWHFSPLQTRHLGTSHSSPNSHQLPISFSESHRWSEISSLSKVV